jgi:ubiquinone/menaquinone biosynthesis C-methylase UbiE
MSGTSVWALAQRPRWTDEPELMDAPGNDPAVVAENLADLRRANRWLGGIHLTVRALQRLTHGLPPGAELTILDVATGGADIPRAVLVWGEERGLRARVLATDISLGIVRAAATVINPGLVGAPAAPATERRLAAGRLQLAVADARALPLADGSVDVAMCSLALHHLPPSDAVMMLCEMRRVARRGVIVNDLVRSWFGYIGAVLYGRFCTRNPLTRNDGPLSVRRAYTRPEMAALARRAGLGPVRFRGFLGYRVVMTTVTTP